MQIEHIDKVTELYIREGVLGATLILAIIAIYFLWKKVEKKDDVIAALQEARVSDAKLYGDSLIKSNDKTHDNLNAMIKIASYLEERK